MKRLQQFIRTVQAFGLIVGFYLEKHFEHFLECVRTQDGKDSSSSLVLIVAVLALMASIKICEWLADAAVERWSWLRRTILGDSYIEGVWFNGGSADKQVFGLLRIAFRDGKVIVEGEQYDGNGSLTATWHCDMAEFDGSTLRYAYEVIYAHKFSHEIHGTSRLSFAKVSGSGIPRSYNGYFQDIGPEGAVCFTGFRVESGDILKKLETPEGKISAVKTLIKRESSSGLADPQNSLGQ